jgi:flagellar basal-body rod modification protein FlgD
MASEVNPVTSSALYSTLSGTTTSSAVAESQDRFLKLLVTQMQNQDPLNPMDNAEMTSQLAQLSTVEGIEQLNASMSGLVESLNANRALEAAALVGRGVMVEGDTLTLADGSAQGAIDFPQAVDTVRVTISDASGGVVYEVDLGAAPEGLTYFSWDGLDSNGTQLSDGAYSYSVSATSAGQAIESTTMSLAQVASVSLDSDATRLITAQLGTIELSDVRQIF